jgi:predicted transcriptional regulator YdeE
MEPRIDTTEEFLVAGLTGKANETGDLWERFSRLSRRAPLKNRRNEDGYEIRFYSGTVEPHVHVGACVRNTGAPSDYETRVLPASTYAVFDIHPVKGYTSQNEVMNKWLLENGKYRQIGLGDRLFAVLIYGARFKGDKDPASVVECWVPVQPRE